MAVCPHGPPGRNPAPEGEEPPWRTALGAWWLKETHSDSNGNLLALGIAYRSGDGGPEADFLRGMCFAFFGEEDNATWWESVLDRVAEAWGPLGLRPTGLGALAEYRRELLGKALDTFRASVNYAQEEK